MFRKILKNIVILIKGIIYNVKKDHVSEFTAQCSYYVILSFVPFLILLLTLIQYTNIDQEQLFLVISQIIPTSMNDFIIRIIKELYTKSIGTVSVSLLFTLLSADKGLFSLVKGLNFVYSNESKRKSIIYLKFISIIKTLAFIVIIVISLVILVFGNPIISTLQQKFGLFVNYDIISRIVIQAVYLFSLFIIFLLLYRFVPCHKIKITSQIPGAIFSSILLVIISLMFSKYLDIFKNFYITYGSLTTLMLIMMWTYACFYVTFLGAEINKYYNKYLIVNE